MIFFNLYPRCLSLDPFLVHCLPDVALCKQWAVAILQFTVGSNGERHETN
jgi:hypothetical protein